MIFFSKQLFVVDGLFKSFSFFSVEGCNFLGNIIFNFILNVYLSTIKKTVA